MKKTKCQVKSRNKTSSSRAVKCVHARTHVDMAHYTSSCAHSNTLVDIDKTLHQKHGTNP